MSAQKPRPHGIFTALAGMLGFSVIAGILVTAMVTPALAVTSVTASNTIGLFDSLPKWIEIGEQPQENRIYAKRGEKNELIATVFAQNREEVKWEEVAQSVKDATIDGEDRRFYDHGGIDVTGLIRATLKNAASGGVSSGASTLSMQLVKNIAIQKALQEDTEDARKAGIRAAQITTLDRKLKEMKLAISLEKKYNKQEILLAYLNIAGFGGNTYGIQAAAQRYYSVDAKDLNIAQAASLIAIVQQPGKRDLGDPEHYAANKDRRDFILKAMYEEGDITKAELTEALATPVDETTVKINKPKNGCIVATEIARQFCDFVVKSVKDYESLGGTVEERQNNWKIGGYDVYTSLDLDMQAIAQATLRKHAPVDTTRLQLGASSSVVQVGTGRILVMAQNKGFDDSEAGNGIAYTALNFNTDQPYGGSSGFQVGSTYKVFTLLNWLNEGHGVNEVVDGSERTINQAGFLDSCKGPYGGTWPLNNNANERGSFTVMKATAQSVNGAFASMALKLDQCKTKQIAESLGIHTAIRTDNPKTGYVENEIQSNPAAILGTNDIAPLSIAAAYAGIANNGIFCKPRAVDSFERDGETLPGQAKECTPSLISADVAAAAMHALQGAMAGYAANPRNGIPHFGKTGTTNSSKQTWIVNSSSRVTSVTWVGNIKGDYPIRTYPGGNARHVISRAIMSAIDGKYGGVAFPAPPGRLLTGTGVTVDDIIGQEPEIGKSIIEARGLVYADGGEVDSDLPAGVIASTSPGAGTILASGMTVTAYTSNGSMSILPNVIGMTYPDATAELNGKEFTNVTEYCVVVTEPAQVGQVVEMQPGGGSAYKRSKEVKLGVGELICGGP